MKKRIGSLLLILALCFTLLPTAAFAAETMDTWDGTADTSWYDENETKFHLKAAKQLAGMAKLVNDNTANFKDKTVYLDNDLDLGGHEWISIGNGANTAWGSFQGIFDGQSHVVYNLYSHEGLKSENKDNNNNLYRNGLFGAICRSARWDGWGKAHENGDWVCRRPLCLAGVQRSQPPCHGSQTAPIKIALQERCFPQGKIHSARQCQSCMQAGRSFHARLFPRRSIGSGGLRIRAVHGTAGECQSRSRRPCGCSRCIRRNTRYTIAPRHGRRQKQ